MIRKSFSSLGRISQKYSPVAALKNTQKTLHFGLRTWGNTFAAGSLLSMNAIQRGFAEAQKKSNTVIELASIEQWEKLLQTPDQAYCIDFYADWCGPCRQLVPLLIEKVEKLSTATTSPIILVKVNVDNFPEIAQALGVSTIPHVFLVKNGEAVDHFVGRRGSSELDDIFKKVL